MLRSLNSLKGFSIGATDGEIGKVDEFYFDDAAWTVRYLIVKTGGWLSGRKVLLSPAALLETDLENEVFPVRLTQEQVKNSPDIDTEQPVSRQQEMDLYSHYGWPHTTGTGAEFYGGIGMTGMMETRTPFTELISDPNPERDDNKNPENPHLQSSSDVRGYQIHASDGEIGEVSDFIVDEDWKVRFLVVDTGNWLPGKKVLVSPRWIREVKWENSAVYVDLSVEAVKHSPEYDSDLPVQEAYEKNLYEYYDKSMD